MITWIAMISTATLSSPLQYAEPVHEWRVTSPQYGVTYVAFSADSTRLIVGLLTGELLAFDLERKRVDQLPSVGREVRGYAFVGEDRYYTLHANGTVSLRDLKTGDPIKTMTFRGEGVYQYAPAKDWVTGYMISSGKTLAISMPGVMFLVAHPARIVARVPNYPAVAFSGNGEVVGAVGADRGFVAFFSASTGKLIRKVKTVKDITE
jgi:WD40 repeat protein